ncbi:MAG: hypothetical protein Q4D29_10985, partial [Lachnospiraceae bacterium]|nr:hypothetical protein [Lachnospiraceae bacterium]
LDDMPMMDDMPNLEADEQTEDMSSVDEDASSLEDDDIAALLQDIENMGKEEASAKESEVSASEDMELADLLSDSDDMDMSEIGDILSKDENNVALDDSIGFADDPDFTSGMLSEEELFGDMDDIISEEEEGGKKKKKKKKVKKSKKNKSADDVDNLEEEGNPSEKKPGLISRIIDMLTVSDDEDDDLESSVKFEESAVDIAIEGAEENDAILAELEEEGGKKKKSKKKKDKKGKKADEESEDGAPSAKDAKKAEKEKKKAEKARLKAERKAQEDALPKKKLPKKKVIPICILCFSLGVVITLLAFFMPSSMDKKKAKEQYDQHNYEATYSLLKGHSLSDKEQLMYDRTVTLLQEERKLDSYNNYMILDMKPEALNALVQGVKKYDELSTKATELEVMPELNGIYTQIVAELNNTFGLSVDKVNQWLSIEDVEEYSYIINSYATGNTSAVIDGMEADMNFDVAPNVNIWDNSVISAEEAEFNDSNN